VSDYARFQIVKPADRVTLLVCSSRNSASPTSAWRIWLRRCWRAAATASGRRYAGHHATRLTGRARPAAKNGRIPGRWRRRAHQTDPGLGEVISRLGVERRRRHHAIADRRHCLMLKKDASKNEPGLRVGDRIAGDQVGAARTAHSRRYRDRSLAAESATRYPQREMIEIAEPWAEADGEDLVGPFPRDQPRGLPLTPSGARARDACAALRGAPPVWLEFSSDSRLPANHRLIADL